LAILVAEEIDKVIRNMFEDSKPTLKRTLVVGGALVLLPLNLANVAFAQATGRFESPPILKAQELAPCDLAQRKRLPR
jgi:hypothetical protein